MEIIVSLLILLLVFGLVYWVAQALLPHPVPLIVLVVGVIVLLLWLVGNVDGFQVGRNGR